MNHIDRFLKKASDAEAKGDTKKARYWMERAEKFEKIMKDIIHIETELKTNLNRR